LVKAIKQKFYFFLGSIPIFKVLEDITVATSLNPGAQLHISLALYFGISMLVFITLHMIEHTLPIGMPRTIIKCTKVMAGIPFFVIV
jgi:hypothetical protein